jgi:hypothetical protein
MNRESFLEGERLFRMKKSKEAQRRWYLKQMTKEHFRKQRASYQRRICEEPILCSCGALVSKQRYEAHTNTHHHLEYWRKYAQVDQGEIDELCGSSITPASRYDSNYPELYLD